MPKTKTGPHEGAPARLGRREFLFGSSLAIATAGAPALGASKGSTVPLDARALAELSATTATAAMRAGELKAEDYANALLDQAERNKDLNAFRTLHPDKVREMARDADRRRRSGMSLGALHGLPIPVKDSVNTKNLPTSNGTRALRDFHPRDDAAILNPLYAAGAFAMGKTNLHELSCGWTSNNATFGPVLNPFDRRRTPGGSSGGSAAAVAARIAPLAIAEDTYGSIRVPATFCGLAGLRVTFGRYSSRGVMPLGREKFDQVGALARSVADLALFDSVVTGTPEPLRGVPLKGVRIAVPPKLEDSSLDVDVVSVVAGAIERLEHEGAILVREALPTSVGEASDVVRGILGYELIQSFKDFLAAEQTAVSLEQLIQEAGPNLVPLLSASRNPGPPEEYQRLLKRRAQISAALEDHYRAHRLDLIAFAPSATAAFAQGDPATVKVNGKDVPLFTSIGQRIGPGSCASLACLVLPAGLTRSGLPVGLEFDAPSGTDRRLLGLGIVLEQALKVGSPRPASLGQ